MSESRDVNGRRKTLTAIAYTPQMQNIQQVRRNSQSGDRQAAVAMAMKLKEKERMKNRKSRNSVAQGAGIAAARNTRRSSRVYDDALQKLHTAEGQLALQAQDTVSSIAGDPKLVAAQLRRQVLHDRLHTLQHSMHALVPCLLLLLTPPPPSHTPSCAASN
jgi:predicted transcriptional regulator